MKYIFVLALIVLFPAASLAKRDSDINVMTQNQYLGADLTAVVAAPDPFAFNFSIIMALQDIASNRTPERIQALARSISDKQPHLVGLQEMFSFGCNDLGSGACSLFAPAFSDHLALTMAELGGRYEVAAEVDNLTLPPAGFPFPGLPVFLDPDGVPDIFVTVLDRDVILSRSDVDASPVAFPCTKPSVDGCNYQVVASVEDTPVGDISIERGFVGVSTQIGGDDYLFVNTHLEVQNPDPSEPMSALIQASQATQLIGTLSSFVSPATRILVVGDINSSPDDPLFPDPNAGPIHPPYVQLENGTDLFGTAISPLSYSDVWFLRNGRDAGFTCCQLSDLSNPTTLHDERIDVIFSIPSPSRVKANVLGDEPSDRTASDLWPSDHSSVSGELEF
ncbi:MAG: hypothetical protein CMJ84_03845 [Planctomycetes bacterium]|nr:hypothetical protein [Planctomycetota bacterium]